MTDCNVLLGRLRPEFFGSIFGHKADETLDVDVVRAKFGALTDKINTDNPGVPPLSVEQAAVRYYALVAGRWSSLVAVTVVTGRCDSECDGD